MSSAEHNVSRAGQVVLPVGHFVNLNGHFVALPPSGQVVTSSGPHRVGRAVHFVDDEGQFVIAKAQTVLPSAAHIVTPPAHTVGIAGQFVIAGPSVAIAKIAAVEVPDSENWPPATVHVK